MIYIFLALFFLLLYSATTLSLKPARQKLQPPLWGGSRRWASLDNIMESPEVTNSSVSWRFSYIYDATTNASAWLHHKGQRDWVCKQGSPALTAQGASCNVIHSSDGWLYIAFPGQQKCCKCTDDPSMGSVRADWLRHPEVKRLSLNLDLYEFIPDHPFGLLFSLFSPVFTDGLPGRDHHRRH